MKALVTGATGFIGSHLVEALLQKNYRVSCLVLPGDEARWINPLSVEKLDGDVLDKESLRKAVAGVDYVFHLAAAVGSDDLRTYYKVNVDGTKNLIDVCSENPDLKRFVFVSSIAAMGPSGPRRVLDEHSVCLPVSDYGKSKWQAERIFHGNGKRLAYTIVRLPLVYGPRSMGGFLTVFKLVKKGFLFMFGQGRNTVAYVDDIADGLIRAAESDRAANRTYILGEKRIYSWHEIKAAVERSLSKKAITIGLPPEMLYVLAPFAELYGLARNKVPLLRIRNIGYVKHSFWQADPARAVEDFNFQVRHPLLLGIERTARWYRENGHL